MRSDARDYTLTAPGSLEAVLTALAANPKLTPIAGGTELMVALGVGRLAARELVSLGGLQELRFTRETADTLTLGAGTTFTDIRKSEIIANEFPLLAQTASWTGSIANQNRGTLGGNIANASPAADNPPALLAYDAQIELISTQGKRTLFYDGFHLGYKKTLLQPGELIYAIHLPRRFFAHRQYVRKVGTRNAQAISKIALAATVLIESATVKEIRLAGASLADRPARLHATEAALLHQPINADTRTAAAAALASEIKPIDDIRSTAKYRIAVACNLLDEFLLSLVS
ncbi:FAD binding domain-containing protein [Terriglobus tenax]|uniref:FAD binding domain-containing protein n=1 Tax=Terriglobus tenax TaxID=1111115 RepID=UPI0021DF949C|nr:xanthine dehydrogenase family protein subunit M [Terriglobus tenax]